MKELEQEMKKVFLAGIGALALTAEKAEALLKELVQKGELTVEQGKVLNEELNYQRAAPAKEKQASPLDRVEQLSREERNALKKKLEELEEKERDGETGTH